MLVKGATGNKPFSDPMMIQFIDAYVRHLASMSKHIEADVQNDRNVTDEMFNTIFLNEIFELWNTSLRF